MTDLAHAPARADLARDDLERQMHAHRRELTGYCYRMLGSAFDADDAVQETMVRAWRNLDGFAGRASLRSWLYRIATNVCLDALNGRNRRALPMDMSPEPSAPVHSSLGTPLPENVWVGPICDSAIAPENGDPADLAVARESVRLAFVTALQALPPRQRAVLILRDVLRWKADEVAELLDTTVASANSALQRARVGIADHDREKTQPIDASDDVRNDLLARYVAAFEAYDMEALVALLHEDATQSMPPWALWLRGADDIAAWMTGPGHGCRDSRTVPLQANGLPAFAQYRPSEAGGHEAWAVHVLETSEGRILRVTTFVGAHLFAHFGLPERLEA